MKLTKISYISLLIASLVAAPSWQEYSDTPRQPPVGKASSGSRREISNPHWLDVTTPCRQRLCHTGFWLMMNPHGYYMGSAKWIRARRSIWSVDNIDPSMEGFIPELYDEAYGAIATINIFLDRLAKYEGTDMEDVRGQFEGEALFLRSYCYYLLYLLW